MANATYFVWRRKQLYVTHGVSLDGARLSLELGIANADLPCDCGPAFLNI